MFSAYTISSCHPVHILPLLLSHCMHSWGKLQGGHTLHLYTSSYGWPCMAGYDVDWTQVYSTLHVWGELACHERLFNPPPQFSRLGTWCPNFFCTSVLLSPVCTWMEGWRGGGLLLTGWRDGGGGGLLLTGWRDGGEEGCYLLDGGMGGGEEGCYLLLCFLFYSIIYILGLVCYKHTIHDNNIRASPVFTWEDHALYNHPK